MNVTNLIACLSLALCTASLARAVTIPTVPVGNLGNAGDVQPQGTFGSVGYNYRIGTTEVTNAQYTEFLNAVDPTGANSLELYNPDMETDIHGGIEFEAIAPNGMKYGVKAGRGLNPVAFVSWFDAIRMANWMHNGQGAGDTENGAYMLGQLNPDGTPVDSTIISRNAGARWFLPNENEWHKAAYHKNDGVTGNYWEYPTSTDAVSFSDQPPGSDAPDPSNTGNFFQNDSLANNYDDGFATTGSTSFSSTENYFTDVGAYSSSASPYGTYDQGGNAIEWIEDIVSAPDERGFRGGDWGDFVTQTKSDFRNFRDPIVEWDLGGFRLATVPEPATLLLAALAAPTLVCMTRRYMRRR